MGGKVIMVRHEGSNLEEAGVVVAVVGGWGVGAPPTPYGDAK